MGTIALVVEELSPGDRISDVTRRVHRFMRAGVPLVWLVDPEERAVTVYYIDKGFKVFEETEELTRDDLGPGFCCLAGEFFTPPGQKQEASE
jgi:Uma2 family endonuclease